MLSVRAQRANARFIVAPRCFACVVYRRARRVCANGDARCGARWATQHPPRRCAETVRGMTALRFARDAAAVRRHRARSQVQPAFGEVALQRFHRRRQRADHDTRRHAVAPARSVASNGPRGERSGERGVASRRRRPTACRTRESRPDPAARRAGSCASSSARSVHSGRPSSTSAEVDAMRPTDQAFAGRLPAELSQPIALAPAPSLTVKASDDAPRRRTGCSAAASRASRVRPP